MFCTGYRYSYPFLAPTDLVDVAENRCSHQWEHLPYQELLWKMPQLL